MKTNIFEVRLQINGLRRDWRIRVAINGGYRDGARRAGHDTQQQNNGDNFHFEYLSH